MNSMFKTISLLGIFILINHCTTSDIKPGLFDIINETDSEFIGTPSDEIIFSGDTGGRYHLQIFKDGRVKSIFNRQRDIFKPFIFENEICGIYDYNGNEIFHTTNIKLQKKLGNRPIRQIQSSIKGKILIIQFRHDRSLYILDSESGQLIKISKVEHRFHGWGTDDSEQKLFLSYDDIVMEYDLKSRQKRILNIPLPGEKRNPFIKNNHLFFNNNRILGFYEIYKYKLDGKKIKPTVIHKCRHDVMMPKIKDNYLYFVENINNEYILKRKSLKNDRTEYLTKKGVVYRYDFYQNDRIAMIYSDFNTPRSLILYDLKNGKSKNISGKSIDIKAEYRYQKRTTERSPAYIFEPDKNKAKGIILFFHPGLHNDFSPRWDTVLMTLLENGFMVVSPNYPMSTGYGKQYKNRPFGDAVKDMNLWKTYLSQTYKNLDLYYMAASSGNILMEECLRFDSENVQAIVSLFGLYARPRPLFDIPALYILGKNDPKVNFEQRIAGLNLPNIKMLTFDDEGHWIRRKANADRAAISILNFMKSANKEALPTF